MASSPPDELESAEYSADFKKYSAEAGGSGTPVRIVSNLPSALRDSGRDASPAPVAGHCTRQGLPVISHPPYPNYACTSGEDDTDSSLKELAEGSEQGGAEFSTEGSERDELNEDAHAHDHISDGKIDVITSCARNLYKNFMHHSTTVVA